MTERKPKVLVLDDGTPGRAEKTQLYAIAAMGKGAEVDRAIMDPDGAKYYKTLPPTHKFFLTDPKKLDEYDVILTDFDGRLLGKENNADNKKFLGFLEQAVKNGVKPIVRMFSGGFNQIDGYGIDLSPFPSLSDDIITIHDSCEALPTIQSAIAKARESEVSAAAPERSGGQPWTTVAGSRGSIKIT